LAVISLLHAAVLVLQIRHNKDCSISAVVDYDWL